MTLEEGLRLKALSDAALVAIIDGRWGVMLDTVPCVTYMQISGVPELAHTGDSGLEACRYQIAMHTSCVLDAVRMMARMKAIFSGFKGNLSGPESPAVVTRVLNSIHHGKQPGVNLFYSTLDLGVWWVRDIGAEI